MGDNLHVVREKLFSQRSKPLWERFPGQYRALVVETNDPLCIGRVRFKSPDLHDFDLPAEDCPWAVPSFDLGGQRTGRFSHPCIGDWIWVSFERQHPYGPVWSGFATPTRRKLYTYPQIHQITPLSVNESGKPADRPNDYDKDYLPKDGRPMAHGWQDRYGNLDIHSSVGFFPEEHQNSPPPQDHDAVQDDKFKQQTNPPEVNNPDKKYMARITKYGIQVIMSDQGYVWKKDGDTGEFHGNAKKDEQFEIKRWQNIQKMLNEGHPRTDDGKGDARRYAVITRYGSRFEMRDTGWAQAGPIQSKSRNGEFGPSAMLSKETEADYRWIKLRTKGGMLFQAYDKGFHPEEDEFIKRKIVDELGVLSEREDLHWKGKDARWIRTVTRHGFKIVLDDRGSDTKQAHKLEDPHGNGILIKGRRSPGVKAQKATGNPRGFYWECNENDEANHTSWGTPMGQTVEMNDRYQYTMIASGLGRNWAAKYQGLKENEFIRKPTMLKDPENSAYHLKLDHDNEYLRLKTRGGKGPRAMMPVNRSGVGNDGIQQGFEAHDGVNGDGPWTEVVDCQHRGIWLSKKHGLGIWRAKKGSEMYSWMDESRKKIVIYNNEANGTVEIYCSGNVNLVSDDDININAKNNVNIRGNSIRMQASDTSTKLTISNNITTNHDILCRELFGKVCKLTVTVAGKKHTVAGGCPKPGGSPVVKVKIPTVPNVIEPTDRAKTYNGPFEECPIDEVEHKIP